MAAVTICRILESMKIKSVIVSIVFPSICHEVMGPDAIIFVFFECWVLSQPFHSPLHFHQEALWFLFAFFHKDGVICISEIIDICPGNLDSSLCFIQTGISHDVLCIEVKWAGWQYIALMYSFPDLEPVCCYMSSSNCCFLTCIQISQEAGKVV